MKEFLVNFIKLFLSIIIILFIEEYFFKVLSLVGINLSINTFIKLIIYVLEFIFIYIIYGEEIRSAFNKYQNKFGSNLLYTIVSYIIVFIAMMIVNYLVKIIASNLDMTYNGLNFINIFKEPFSLDLIITFIVDMLIIPFVKVAIFVLGINNLVKGKAGSIICGLSYAVYTGFLLGGNFGVVFIDIIDECILFILLSYVYKKNGNITFSILTYIFYVLFSALIMAKLL